MTTVAVLAFGLGLAGVAWAEAPPDDADAPGEATDEGYLDDLPELPPPPAGAPDQAPQEWRYNGPHAITAEAGGGWCDIRQPHSHPYPPFDEYLFQEDDGGYDFLGDPTDFGYDGSDLSWYEAEHPITAGWGLGWCFMTWPHRHIYRPGPSYNLCGTYYCYRGPRDGWYWNQRVTRGPYWKRYPSFYWGKMYLRTHKAASPGRWASVHLRPGRGAVGSPARGGAVGRPGGVARPITIPHRGAALRPLTGPRARVATRAMTAPRALTVPRTFSAPRAYAPPRAGTAPRAYAAPRTVAAPRASAPPGARPTTHGVSAARSAPSRPATTSHGSSSSSRHR